MDPKLRAELINQDLEHRVEDLEKQFGVRTFKDMARIDTGALRRVLFFNRVEVEHFESLRDICIDEMKTANQGEQGGASRYPEGITRTSETAKGVTEFQRTRPRDQGIMTESSTSSSAHVNEPSTIPNYNINPPTEPEQVLETASNEELPTHEEDPAPKPHIQESYSMCTTGQTKGIGLIIMNNKFEGHGVEKEGKIIRSLFIKMGLEIKLLTKRTPEEILFEAQQIANKYHLGYSLLVVGICTHCEDGDMLYASYGVYSLNNDLMPIFKPANCPSLRGKPKIFLINSCHPVLEDKEVLSDDVVAHGTTDESDFLVVHSTVMRGKGFTNFDRCFIAILEKTFEQYRDRHLLEIITLAHKQCKPVEAEGDGSTKYDQKCRRNSTLTKVVFIPK